MFNYLGCCVHLSGESISDMAEKAREISYKTLIKYVDHNEIKSMFGVNPPVHKDWAVSFYKSTFENQKCYYIQHSMIEYVFIN